MNIIIHHKGEDYHGLTLDGIYQEVTLSEGKAIKSMILAIKTLIEDSKY